MNNSIKMFIDDEEVVSDNEFTINEEMLSASSTILNNCYPKSWELTRDYINNFYYPKDYSKFLLGEGDFSKGNTEFTILEENGANVRVETNVEKELNKLDVYGGVYQATRSGKNLYNYEATTSVTSGVTADIEGWITVTYDNTGGSSNKYFNYWTSNLSLNVSTNYRIITEIKTVSGSGSLITMSNSGNSGQFTGSIGYSFGSLSNNVVKAETKTTKSSFTSVSDGLRTYVQFQAGQSGSITFRLSVLADTSVTPANFVYEAYGVSPSTDYPSKLINVGYQNLFEGSSSVWSDWYTPGYNLNNRSFYLYFTQYNMDKFIKGQIFTLSFDVEFEGVTETSGQTKSWEPQIVINETTDNMYNGQWFSFSNQSPIYYELQNGIYHMEHSFELTNDRTNYVRYGFVPRVNYWASGKFRIKNAQLQIGAKASNFIDYGKYGVSISVIGKNLFNKNLMVLGGAIDIATNVMSVGNNFRTIYVPIKENTTYHIHKLVSNRFNIGYSNLDYVTIPQTLNNVSSLSTTRTDYTFTTPSGSKFIYMTLSKITDDTTNINDLLNSIQIEENDDFTSYEEYKNNEQVYILNRPLRGIGNVKDILHVEKNNVYVERKIGDILLKGGETWYKGNNDGGYPRYYTVIADAYFHDDTLRHSDKVKSDYFIATTTASPQSMYQYRDQMLFDVPTYLNTLQLFKQWVATHNVEVQYVLNTPVIETLQKQNTPIVYEGKSYLSLITSLTTTMDIYYYWKNFNVLFAGVVKNSGEISLNPRHPHYCSLQILDYKTFLSESNTLDFVIANKTIKEAIEMVVNAVSNYGFVVGNINIDSSNDIIGAYSTLNKTAYDVFQYLSEISGSRWRARYVDSSTMAIDFYTPENLPQASDIEYTKQYWEDNNIVDLTFNYGTRDYRNKQIMLSDEVYASIEYDETLISNGYSNTFVVQNNIGSVTRIVVNNEEKTCATTNDKQMGIDADFYYTPGKNTLESNEVYSAGIMIHLTYQPLVKGRQIVTNTDEIDRISLQTKTEGIIARYETRNDVLSSEELEKIAQTYIDYKGKAEVILTLKTQNKDLYNIGEVVYFNAPIEELKQNYMVKSKKTEYVVINEVINLFYEYELTSSFNSEKAINYFDNQRNKVSGNISEGESITRNIDIETEANIIWSNSTVSAGSITIDGDNVLNSVLNSPFVE